VVLSILHYNDKLDDAEIHYIVKIKDSVITTDQRSDVPVRMVGQEINVKQKLVVILALIQHCTYMLDDYREHCIAHVHYKLLCDMTFLFHIFYHSNRFHIGMCKKIPFKQKLFVILTLVMETENVVYLNIIQFVIVMQDGKDHNVSNPILVPSNRVKSARMTTNFCLTLISCPTILTGTSER
jgi:hypothetical protein